MFHLTFEWDAGAFTIVQTWKYESETGPMSSRTFLTILIITTVLVVGILSLVAIPRYMETQKGVHEYAARVYIDSLNTELLMREADHYLIGVDWVKSGEEVMKLLRDRDEMPDGMMYANDTWTLKSSNLRWVFKKATENAPARIEVVK
jgi:hypothetical protein